MCLCPSPLPSCHLDEETFLESSGLTDLFPESSGSVRALALPLPFMMCFRCFVLSGLSFAAKN